MPTWREFTLRMRSALIEVAPPVGADASGRPLPAIATKHTLGVLAKYVGGISDGLSQVTEREEAAVSSLQMDADGVISGAFGGVLSLRTIPNAKYIGGIADTFEPWRRLPLDRAIDQGGAPSPTIPLLRAGSFEPGLSKNVLKAEETALLAETRSLMRNWQQAVNAASASFATQRDLSARMSTNDLLAFWSGIDRISSSLDAIQANPPLTGFEAVKQATRDAIVASGKVVEEAAKDGAKIAGQVAAEAGDVAGEAAGKFLGGFFNQATILSVAVAGGAIYLATR